MEKRKKSASKRPMDKSGKKQKKYHQEQNRLFWWIVEGLKKVFKKGKTILDFRKFEKKKRIQFFMNITVGFLAIIVMHGLETTQWGERVLNSTFDRFIRMDANKAVNENADINTILLVDLQYNEQNTEKVKQNKQKISYLSPRDKIARALEMSFKGGANVVVLDFLFEETDCCDPQRDAQLRMVLSENKSQTKVIFPARISHNRRLINPIFNDEINNNPNYFRAIPTVYASRSDSIVRYWKIFQGYENEHKQKKILWSIPVLATALYVGKIEELKKLEQKIVSQNKSFNISIGEICWTQKEVQEQKEKLVKKRMLLPIDDEDFYQQRIRFFLIPKDCISEHLEGNILLPRFKDLTPEFFKNKIVIIGNSDPNVGDFHPTPVGDMPGMYIHGNIVYTLSHGLQPRRAPWWVSILINMFILLLGAYLFHYLDSFLADLLWMVTSIIVFGYIAYIIFFRNFGVFPNFIFGIAVVGYFETMKSFLEYLQKRKDKRKEVKKKEVTG